MAVLYSLRSRSQVFALRVTITIAEVVAHMERAWQCREVLRQRGTDTQRGTRRPATQRFLEPTSLGLWREQLPFKSRSRNRPATAAHRPRVPADRGLNQIQGPAAPRSSRDERKRWTAVSPEFPKERIPGDPPPPSNPLTPTPPPFATWQKVSPLPAAIPS